MFAQFKRLTWKASLLTTLISMLAFTLALAASGDLDTTFSGDGLVTTNIDPYDLAQIRGIAIQTDGKIIGVGSASEPEPPHGEYFDFAVVRYKLNGSLDTSFSRDGKLTTDFFGGDDSAYDVAVQSDGKIIVAGNANGWNGLARYNPDGTLDATFSGDGKQLTHYGDEDGGLAIQPDGKIVVASSTYIDSSLDIAVYRLNTNGTLDITFSGDGKVEFGFGAGRGDWVHDLVLQSDGKIVVAGQTDGNFAIARLNTNGTLDKTFSANGRASTDFGGWDGGAGMALQPNGKIVVVGSKDDYIAVGRYNTDGSLDTTFNGTGKKVFRFTPGYWARAEDVTVQSNGKIIVLGSTDSPDTPSPLFALARLNSSGSFDKSFSEDGKVTIYFGGFGSGYTLAVQSDGKYLLAGIAYSGGGLGDFALARVLP